MVMVPSPLSVITWSFEFREKTLVNVPPVFRLVKTFVPCTLSR
jgi:hypothetical protein